MLSGHRTLTSLAAICLVASGAAATEAPGTRAQGLIKAFKAVKPRPEDGSALGDRDKEANRRAFEVLDGYFDFDRMTTECIGPRKKEFSDQQMKQYKEMFRELIRLVAYPGSGAFLSRAKIQMKKAKVKGKTAETPMFLEVPEDDLEMDVVFYWGDGGTWRLIDVAFDGAALSKDYRNQFARIIDKDGVDGLIKKLEKRLKKEREAGMI